MPSHRDAETRAEAETAQRCNASFLVVFPSETAGCSFGKLTKKTTTIYLYRYQWVSLWVPLAHYLQRSDVLHTSGVQRLIPKYIKRSYNAYGRCFNKRPSHLPLDCVERLCWTSVLPRLLKFGIWDSKRSLGSRSVIPLRITAGTRGFHGS